MTKNNHGFEPKQEITIGGIPFTIIQAEENWVKCISSRCVEERTFDAHGGNNFSSSDLQTYLNGAFLQCLIKAGAPEEMFEYFGINLTADDGLNDYGFAPIRIGLITCDEYRLLRGNIPALPDEWWWTGTPHSPKNKLVRIVCFDGSLGERCASERVMGIRPLCILKSEILRFYIDRDEQKRGQMVDTVKNIVETYGIRPEEIFR